jgi:putative peptidoglycan lipid II flippase
MFTGIGSVISVNALVAAAIAIGLVNNVLIAAVFGLTRRVDAFFAAMVLPSLFMILCVDYLGKNFLPVYAIAKKEGEASASRLTSTVITTVFLFAVVITALLMAFNEPLFDLLLPGFDSEETMLVAQYFMIMAPAIVLMTVNAFHEYVCQYDERFSTVMAIRIALPIMNLASIVVLAPVLDEFSLPVGYLLGHIVVFVLMAWNARYSFKPSFDIRPHLEKKVFVNSAILMSTGFIARTRSVVINVLGSTLGDGAISALALAMKLTEPLERFAFTGAKMFMFSRTARLYADRNEHELGRAYSTGLRMGFLLLTPLLWWIGLNSETIVSVFFARGEFTQEMVLIVAAALVGMAPAVLFQGLNQVLANAFYATGRVLVPAMVMPFGMLIFVAAAVPLAGVLETQGLALAMTVASVVVFIVLFAVLSSVLAGLDFGHVSTRLLIYGTFAGLAMSIATAVLRAAEASPITVAAGGLPLGGALFLTVLALGKDRTFARLRRYLWDAFSDRHSAVAAQRDP